MRGEVKTKFCIAHASPCAQDFSSSVKHGCKKSKILGKIQVSMALFLYSYIHQGDDLFSVQCRCKQCAFNCPKYTTDRLVKNKLNNVLLQGDKMYLQALDNGFVVLEPGVEFMSV